MAAEFLLPRTEGKPLSVRLDRDAVVGRGSDAGLRISSRRVSRTHCKLHLDDSRVRVSDLGSRNGTFVNGTAIGKEPAPVPLGATLSVGGVNLKLVKAGEETYRPDGAAMLAELEPHAPDGDEQDVPGGVVVGSDSAADLSDDAVAVTGLDPEEPDSAAQTCENLEPVEDLVLGDDDAIEDEVPGDGLAEDAPEEGAAAQIPPASGAADEPADEDEDAAFAFLGGEDDADAGPDSAALKALPGADARDQSSFAGFDDDADGEADVDSALLGFLDDSK